MAIASNISWRQLLSVCTWTPLQKTGIETTALSENVRKVEEGKYLVVVEGDLTGQVIDGPYVTMVAWAESDGAVLRAIDTFVEADTGASNEDAPPVELLPTATASTYAAIVAALKSCGESVLESAEYRIATDGVFLHKVVRSSLASFYFRSPEEISDERPFAITHRIGMEP